MTQPNWAHFIAMQAGVVPISFGTPGEAKTAIHRQQAKVHNRRFLQVILSQKLREDVGGVPAPVDIEIDGHVHRVVQNLMPEEMVRAMHEPSVLLLDELNQASHDVLGAAQEIINNPPANCWMAAVCNPVEQSTAGQELSPPVVNRCCVLKWESLDETRREGWKTGFAAYPLPELPVVAGDFLDAGAGMKWGNLLLAFEERKPEFFHEAFPKRIEDAAEPWCSPRSWHNCGVLMAACDSAGGHDETRAKLAHGCVGHAATEFLNYVKNEDLPDPADLLDDPNLLRLPRTYHLAAAMMGSIVGEVRRRGTSEAWEQGVDCLEVAFEQRAEVSMATYGAMVKVKPASHMPKDRQSSRSTEMKELITGIRNIVQNNVAATA